MFCHDKNFNFKFQTNKLNSEYTLVYEKKNKYMKNVYIKIKLKRIGKQNKKYIFLLNLTTLNSTAFKVLNSRKIAKLI